MYVYHRGGGVFESKTGYTFAFHDNNVIIREINDTGVSRRLLNPTTFAKDLPNQLVEEYNFWMMVNGEKEDIELRPVSSGDSESTIPIHHYKILLDSEMKGKVIHSASNRTMLNFSGPVLSNICDSFLWRLEQKPYVIPWLPAPQSDLNSSPDQWSLCIELHRLHLHIEIRTGVSEGTRIVLREFDNMHVSPFQSLDTFIGLKHLLVLERPSKKMRTVIVPHFNAFKTEQKYAASRHHQLVPADPLDLNQEIPFFAFDEDCFIHQMKPNGTETDVSWLMCAYLHGATSSAMRDPLTGLTGLEMAVQQLRRCYRNKPFDVMSLKILDKIKNLSVKRSVAYDTEVVIWDPNRSAYSQSEVYTILASCIISKSQELNELYGIEPTDIDDDDQKDQLSDLEVDMKGYAQYEWTYSLQAQLDTKEKKMINLSPRRADRIILPPKYQRCSNQVYEVMHAFR